eukprot:TRINITY_DN7042_c0_g1_i10.p1 TRINITY_DN7042_c0_g1~~TRINITY_DN7042_c0_g1_i10.p1  ORF type:complete len:473 (+),score=63.17 TRINITY_DN7042_c0_g1_i10:155-1573(+)
MTFPLFLFLLATVLCSPIKYTGFAFTFSKDFVPEYYLEIYRRAARDSLDGKDFKDRSMSILYDSGTFTLTKIKAANSILHLSSNLTLAFTKDSLSLDLNENKPDVHIFSINVTFDYSVREGDEETSKGNGVFRISSNHLNLHQTFHQSHSKVTFTMDVENKVVSITGPDPDNSVHEWIRQLFMDKKQGLLENLFKRQCEKEAVSTFGSFYAMSQFLDPGEFLNITMANSFTQIQEQNKDCLIFTFDTVITVKNRPYRKELIRKMAGTYTEATGLKFGVCMSYGMIPAVAEVRGKHRDFLIVVEPEEVGFTGKVNELYSAMPRLEEMFAPNEEYVIDCMIHEKKAIVPLSNQPHTAVQIPMNCIFSAKESGQEILSLDFTPKFFIEYVLTTKELSLMVDWNLSNLSTVTFDVEKSLVRVQDHVIIQQMVRALPGALKIHKIFPEPIQLKVGYDLKNVALAPTKQLMCIDLSKK